MLMIRSPLRMAEVHFFMKQIPISREITGSRYDPVVSFHICRANGTLSMPDVLESLERGYGYCNDTTSYRCKLKRFIDGSLHIRLSIPEVFALLI